MRKAKFAYLEEQEDKEEANVAVCPQYIVLTPFDTYGWPSLKQELSGFVNERYSKDRLLDYIEQRFRNKGYPNIRLLRKIRTEYFWASVLNYMVECVINDSHLLSCSIPVLNQRENTTVKLTKYQIFLMLSHMLLGTFPVQLYNNDGSLGRFMAVYDDEDEVNSRDILQYRLNKLKNIAKYMCLIKKRSEDNEEIMDYLVIFQRSYYLPSHEEILSDSSKFCKVEPKVGDFYNYNNEMGKVSINNISYIKNGRMISCPLPGHNTINNYDLHVEERIFFTHPEMFILPVIMDGGLGPGETVIIHGAEKYSQFFAVGKHEDYDFKTRFVDESPLNKLHNFKNTSYMFVPRQPYDRKKGHDIIPDIITVCSAMKLCKTVRGPYEPLVSGKVSPVERPPAKGIVSSHRIEIPWEIKFMIDWLAATIMGYQSLQFYVEDASQQADIRIMCREMSEYTVRDVVEIVEQYHEFRNKDRAKISLIEFMKDFVL